MAYQGYTVEDLQSVTRAIVDLATGKRVVQVTTRGRTVTYSETDLNKLRALKTEIMTELNEGSGTPTLTTLATGKGL